MFYSDIGMCDPQVTDYLGEMLSKLIHMDDFYPFRDAAGRRLEDLAAELFIRDKAFFYSALNVEEIR